MKKRDLLNLNGALSVLESRQFSVKFSYFVAKNKVLLKDEINALDEAKRPSAEYLEYDQNRIELANSFADKNEDGNSRIENNNFVITENIVEFQSQVEKLKKEYDEHISTNEQKLKEFEDLLDTDVKYEGPKIKLLDIPDGIEPSVLAVLITADLIIDDQE